MTLFWAIVVVLVIAVLMLAAVLSPAALEHQPPPVEREPEPTPAPPRPCGSINLNPFPPPAGSPPRVNLGPRSEKERRQLVAVLANAISNFVASEYGCDADPNAIAEIVDGTMAAYGR